MPYDFNKAMANPLTSLGLSLVGNTQNPGQAIQQGLQQGLQMKKQFDEENANKALSKAVMSGADPKEALSVYAEAGGDPMKGAQFISTMSKRDYDKYKTVGDSLIDLDTGKSIFTAPADYSKEPLQEIYDPTSPSGTRLVGRREAAGKPGKPGSGFKFTTDKDGNVSLEQGSGLGMGGGSGLGAPTINKINEKTFNATESLARLNDTKKSFDPKYLQLGTRTGAKITAMKDFLGKPLSPEEKAQLQEFTTFKRRATDNINRTLNELSGAAVSPTEEVRLKGAQPNAGNGIFDGDSPAEFEAKQNDAIKLQRAAILRHNFALTHGMNPLKTGVELDDVPGLIDKRGAELEGEIKQQYPQATQEQIQAEVTARLATEFGMDR